MEILKGLKPCKLRQCFAPLPQALEIPFIPDRSFQELHVIDENKSRHRIISDIIIKSLESSPNVVILMDLDYSWNSNNPYYIATKDRIAHLRPERLVIKRDLTTITDLIKYLKQLKDPEYFQQYVFSTQAVLGMVVLDNISLYHWPMVSEQNYPMEYSSLFQALKSLQLHFNCAVISSSLMKFFETGLTQSNGAETLKDISTIPSILLDRKVVIHSSSDRDGINGKLFLENEVYTIRKSEILKTG